MVIANKPESIFIVSDNCTLTALNLSEHTTFLKRFPKKAIFESDFNEPEVLRSLKYSTTKFALIVKVAVGKEAMFEAINTAAKDMLEMLKGFIPKEFKELEKDGKK